MIRNLDKASTKKLRAFISKVKDKNLKDYARAKIVLRQSSGDKKKNYQSLCELLYSKFPQGFKWK